MLLLNALMVLYTGDTSVVAMPNYSTQRGVSILHIPRFGVWKRAWQSAVHQEVCLGQYFSLLTFFSD